MIAVKQAKKLLHDVVGSLRINCHFPRWAVDMDGLSKQLVVILVELLGHLAAQQVGGKFY